MDVSQIASLLGLASTAPAVEAQFVRLEISERPHVTIDKEDVDGPVVETQHWVGNLAAGIEFGFEDEASWRGLDESEQGRGPMVLTQLYLYGDHADVLPYRGILPFGLQLRDDRTTVRAKLAALEGTRRSYQRDTWELPEFRMTVAYAGGGSHIEFILCALRPDPLPTLDDDEIAQVPVIETIIALLGRPWQDRAVREALVPLGVDWHTRDTGQGRVANFRATHGFEVGFQAPTGVLVFSYAVFYRDREFEAREWRGGLPFEIAFDDSPEVLLRKIRLPADSQNDTDFTGFAFWRLQQYGLHISYSTMENLILQVRVTAPDVYP
jgi:hypothetical protein